MIPPDGLTADSSQEPTGEVFVKPRRNRRSAKAAGSRMETLVAEVERGNDAACIGVVAHKKRGSGDPAEQFVSMTLETFARLLEGGDPL